MLVIAAALVVAACGADDGGEVATLETVPATTVTTLAPEDIDTELALLEFTACLRENGIDIADPVIGPDGLPSFSEPPDLSQVTSDDLANAQAACAEELRSVTLGFIGTDLTGLQDTLLEYARCMRENGYELADPDFSSIGQGFQGPFGEDVDLDDPDFIAADAECSYLIEDLGIGG